MKRLNSIQKKIIFAILLSVFVLSVVCGLTRKGNTVSVSSCADRMIADVQDENYVAESIVFLTIDDEAVPMSSNN